MKKSSSSQNIDTQKTSKRRVSVMTDNKNNSLMRFTIGAASENTNSNSMTPRSSVSIETEDSSNQSHIKVFCRIRPMNEMEINRNENKCVEIIGHNIIKVNIAKQHLSKAGIKEIEMKSNTFILNKIFRMDSTQEEIYAQVCQETINRNSARISVILDITQGFNGAILAYGQTSSGKTHTMIGNDSEMGIIPRIYDNIINSLNNQVFKILCSVFQLYDEEFLDLLNSNNKLELVRKEDQIYYEEKPNIIKRITPKSRRSKNKSSMQLNNLEKVEVKSKEDFTNVLQKGLKQRVISATKMNQNSSRSHVIFMISVIQKNPNGTLTKGTLYLVDLAGSERVDQTTTKGQIKESININKSLFCLRKVLKELITPNQKHISYKDSKLTSLLENAIGGNSKTSLIATCSPAESNAEETLRTLEFGSMAQLIKNSPEINSKIQLITNENCWKMIKDLEQVIEEKDKRVKDLEHIIEEKNKMIIELEQHIDKYEMDSSAKLSIIKIKREKDKIAAEEYQREENKELEKQRDEQFRKIFNDLGIDDAISEVGMENLQLPGLSRKNSSIVDLEFKNTLRENLNHLQHNTLEEHQISLDKLRNLEIKIKEYEEQIFNLKNENSNLKISNDSLSSEIKYLRLALKLDFETSCKFQYEWPKSDDKIHEQIKTQNFGLISKGDDLDINSNLSSATTDSIERNSNQSRKIQEEHSFNVNPISLNIDDFNQLQNYNIKLEKEVKDLKSKFSVMLDELIEVAKNEVQRLEVETKNALFKIEEKDKIIARLNETIEKLMIGEPIMDNIIEKEKNLGISENKLTPQDLNFI